jgi:hypothetical protein
LYSLPPPPRHFESLRQ